MKRFLILILAVFILLPGLSQAQQVADANLQNCIAAAAGRSFDSLSDRDLAGITKLECTEKGIASITGIGNLFNLVELYLNDNRIADIMPLAGLNRLTKLYLEHNRITDISPVSGLKELKELYLSGNQIEKIGSLAKLNLLEELLLGDNQIEDLRPLVTLTNLDYLYIFNNQITDITPLKGLTRLVFLDGSGNSISDISALGNLGSLARLFLNGNSIADIKPLAGLKSLRTLFLGYNQVSDISALTKLNELKIVDLSANSIAEIAALKNLTKLQRVTLDNNLVSDVSPLVGLPNLHHVALLNNCVKDIGSLADVKSVTGIEYQHDLCTSPDLVKKTITHEWLDDQLENQCADYMQDSSLGNRYEYDYCPDGLYYGLFIRNKVDNSHKRLVCRLRWNNYLGDFLLALETVGDTTGTYRTYKYGNNTILYVQDGKIKGQSKKTRVSTGFVYELETFMDVFKVKYETEKSYLNGREVITARKKDHIVREIVGDELNTLQFFEPVFYAAEIEKQK